MNWTRTVAIVTVLASAHAGVPAGEVSPKQKSDFLALLPTLPHQGEFLTAEGVDKGAPHVHVLFALTAQDVDDDHLYPVLALSRGLCDRPKYRSYGVQHFSEIAHPFIKAFWAAALFNEHTASPEIHEYLRALLGSTEGTKTLSEIIGPAFDDFKKQVANTR